tara:strand:+ start:8907 stop:9230 length:324 start_codon:yes stop_codon:yes gene_type:complete
MNGHPSITKALKSPPEALTPQCAATTPSGTLAGGLARLPAPLFSSPRRSGSTDVGVDRAAGEQPLRFRRAIMPFSFLQVGVFLGDLIGVIAIFVILIAGLLLGGPTQ